MKICSLVEVLRRNLCRRDAKYSIYCVYLRRVTFMRVCSIFLFVSKVFPDNMHWDEKIVNLTFLLGYISRLMQWNPAVKQRMP